MQNMNILLKKCSKKRYSTLKGHKLKYQTMQNGSNVDALNDMLQKMVLFCLLHTTLERVQIAFQA